MEISRIEHCKLIQLPYLLYAVCTLENSWNFNLMKKLSWRKCLLFGVSARHQYKLRKLTQPQWRHYKNNWNVWIHGHPLKDWIIWRYCKQMQRFIGNYMKQFEIILQFVRTTKQRDLLLHLQRLFVAHDHLHMCSFYDCKFPQCNRQNSSILRSGQSLWGAIIVSPKVLWDSHQ